MSAEATDKALPRILVIAVDTDFSSGLINRLNEFFAGQIDFTSDLAAGLALLDGDDGRFICTIVDLDDQQNETDAAADRLLDYAPPVIALFAQHENERSKQHLENGVLDCIGRDIPTSRRYIRRLVQRLIANKKSKALVVDDSPTFRSIITSFLETQQFEVFEAEDGVEAWSVLEAEPDIRLAIVDHEMPEKDGFTLTTEIRQKFDHERIALIGLSGSGTHGLGISFIKYGADEFVSKPFDLNEFLARVNDCMNKQDMLRELKQRARIDYLTKLYNRHYFFDIGENVHANARRGNLTLAVAMIDIDHFKRINDTLGHDAGDRVLATIATNLKQRARDSDIVARMGGEEFCYLVVSPDIESVELIFERIRASVAQKPINVDGKDIMATVSIGVTMDIGDSLDDMIKTADRALYRAKNGGRNQVVMG